MVMEMVATSNRAFWQLGDQVHLGPIPRPAFGDFLRKGFESAGATIAADALEHILDAGEDVPYNVQHASECWVLITDCLVFVDPDRQECVFVMNQKTLDVVSTRT